jgi:hypothetical protein
VTTVEGIVSGSQGALVELSIVPENTVRFFALAGANPSLVQPPDSSGRFKYAMMPPGHYAIWARAGAPPAATSGRGNAMGAPTSGTLYAVAEVEVQGQPIAGVTLQLLPGSRISGRMIIDASTAAGPDLSRLRISAQSPGPDGTSTIGGTRIGSFSQLPSVTVGADGGFEIVGLPPGDYKLGMAGPAAQTVGQQWWFRSGMLGDQDLLDAGVTLVPGRDVSGVVLTLTDRRSEIAGTLQSLQGLPAPEYYIVAMPADRAMWAKGSRRLRFTRPASTGAFSFLDLPPGEYLLVALTELDPSDWQTADFLATLAPAGVKVTLGLNERIRQDLQIGK